MHEDEADSGANGCGAGKARLGQPGRPSRQTRAERLAAELRANLRKRKALARTRHERPDGSGER